jgi:hypothetical protein
VSALALALLLLLLPSPADGQAVACSLAIDDAAAPSLPAAEALRAGLARLFSEEYGRLAVLSFDAPPGGESVRVSLGLAEGVVRVDTDLTVGSSTRSLSSTVPRGCPAGLLAAMAGDVAFLHFAARGFEDLPLAPGPRLTAVIGSGALQALTGWNPEELEPVSLAPAGDGMTVCFPHGYLSLGPGFRVTGETVRDLHAQAAGREPLLLSGALADGAGRLVLLCEREGKAAVTDPRLGTRRLLETPGLTARGGALLADGSLAAAADGADAFTVFPMEGGAPRAVPAAGGYRSAFCRDREGNLWAWDSAERRVRILTPGGAEVYAIKPLFGADAMPVPQAMAACDDGSLLLAGYGELWRFEPTGIPVWRLTRVPGRPAERLPPSFGLAVTGADGSFAILDAPSRRLLAFSPAPAGDEASLADLLARLDGRSAADLARASALALGCGLELAAWEYGDRAAAAGAGEAPRVEAGVALMRRTAGLYAGHADSLARDLLYARADGAYLAAGEALRRLAAEAPGDPEAAGMLEAVVARRQEVRAALARGAELVPTLAEARVRLPPDADGPVLALRVRLRNDAAAALTGARLSVGLPGCTPTPSLVQIEDLGPGQEREVNAAFAGLSGIPADGARACALATGERAGLIVSAALSFPVAAAVEPEATEAAAARRARPDDALIRRTADALLAEAPAARTEPEAVAGVLDALSVLRAGAAAAAGAAPGGAASAAGADLRAALRGLAADSAGWCAVMASIAGAFGGRPGIVRAGESLFVLAGTGTPLSQALAARPGLSGHAALLTRLSRDGNLWLPLSVEVPPAGAEHPTAWAAARGITALEADPLPSILWPLPARPAAPLPVSYPFELPATAPVAPLEDLLGRVDAALAAPGQGAPADAGGGASVDAAP